jgi:hypothetical protein
MSTWHGTRDVSQRVEPNVRPLGCAASIFIADKARHLSIPLTGDVSPQHLMSPVHSTGRRCAASAFYETCPFHGQAATSPFRRRRAWPFHWQAVRHAAACTTPIITWASPRKQPQHIYTTWTIDNMAPGDCSGISYFYNVFPPFCSWAHMSGLNILVRALLEL